MEENEMKRNEAEAEAEIREHMQEVSKYLSLFSCELLKRAVSHDKSKLEEPEKSIFTKHMPLLKDSTFGSEEYKKNLEKMRPALDHHYACNRHHPEFNNINCFSPLDNSIRGMDLIDIVEMLCDWLAATKQHADGNINRSIEIGEKRFGINEQLSQIFRNTIARLKEKEKQL